MKNTVRQLRGTLVFAALTLNTVFWFVPLFLLALVKLVLPFDGPRKGITAVLMMLGENWISGNALILRSAGSRDWAPELPPGLHRRGWYLVLANHQTWVDIIVLQTVFNRRIPFLKFFIKQELIWFPLLGIAWWALDMPFMKRYSPSYLARHPERRGRDLEATRRACRKFRRVPTSVINFVEGTRFSEAKREQRGSPFEHLLQPRAGGVAVAIDSMGELFDAMVDTTIVYRNGIPSFWGMCCGDYVAADVDIRTESIPAGLLNGNYAEDRTHRKAVHQWLTGLWSRKDERIGRMRRQLDEAA